MIRAAQVVHRQDALRLPARRPREPSADGPGVAGGPPAGGDRVGLIAIDPDRDRPDPWRPGAGLGPRGGKGGRRDGRSRGRPPPRHGEADDPGRHGHEGRRKDP